MQEDKASMELALDSVLAKIDKLNERLTILEKEREQLVEINEMLLETINEEDDDVEKLQKLMEAALASIRELEEDNTSMEEQLAENLELIRKLYVKVDLLEGVKDFQENVKPKLTRIGTYLYDKYKPGYGAKEDFYDKYVFLCRMLNAAPLTEEELWALPVEDFPMHGLKK